MTTPEIPIKQHLAALAAFPATLKQQLGKLDDDTLRFRPATGEWSIIEVIGHLAEMEAVWDGRIRQMLAADHPAFPMYAPDPIVRERDYQHKQLGALLALLGERREQNLEFFNILRPAQLARTGRHAVRGDISVATGIALLAGHDQLHADQIAANLAAARIQEHAR